MIKIKITQIFTKEEVSAKTGKPYTRYAFKCDKYGESWVSGFGSEINKNWVKGQELEIGKDVFIDEVPNPNNPAKPYINFSTPKAEDINNNKIAELEARIKKLEEVTFSGLGKLKDTLSDAGLVEPPDEDVPF